MHIFPFVIFLRLYWRSGTIRPLHPLDPPIYYSLSILCCFSVADLSLAQRKLSRSLENFTFVSVNTTQTDDERMIQESLKEFGALIAKIEDVRDRIVSNLYLLFALKVPICFV